MEIETNGFGVLSIKGTLQMEKHSVVHKCKSDILRFEQENTYLYLQIFECGGKCVVFLFKDNRVKHSLVNCDIKRKKYNFVSIVCEFVY